MHIAIEARTVYGNRRLYVRDERIKAALQILTRRDTLNDDDISALVFLGCSVTVTDVVPETPRLPSSAMPGIIDRQATRSR